jgi:hypothetical protein
MKKKLLIGGLAAIMLAGSLVVVSVVGATENSVGAADQRKPMRSAMSVDANGSVTLRGQIVSIPPTAGPQETPVVVVAGWFGNYSVNVLNAKIMDAKGDARSRADLRVGDWLTVRGTASLTGMAITATSVKDHSLPVPQPTPQKHAKGWASDIDYKNRTFLLHTEKNETIRVALDANAQIVISGTAPQNAPGFDGLKEKAAVEVWGYYDPNIDAAIPLFHASKLMIHWNTPALFPAAVQSFFADVRSAMKHDDDGTRKDSDKDARVDSRAEVKTEIKTFKTISR